MRFFFSALFSVVATAVLVVGSLWLAARIRGHSRAAGHGTAVVTTLRTALALSESYLSTHGSWAGIEKSQGLAAELPRAKVVGRSTSPTQVSVAVRGAGNALVLTAMDVPVHGVPPAEQCLGVLVVRRPLDAPLFPGYAVTRSTGTYYFVARLSGPGRTCDAVVVRPPAGSYLTGGGFPSVDAPSPVPLP